MSGPFPAAGERDVGIVRKSSTAGCGGLAACASAGALRQAACGPVQIDDGPDAAVIAELTVRLRSRGEVPFPLLARLGEGHAAQGVQPADELAGAVVGQPFDV